MSTTLLALALALVFAAGADADADAHAHADGGCDCTPPPVEHGRLDKSIIGRIVRDHASQVRSCFDRETIRTPGVYGTVKVTWLIDTDGKVIEASVVDSAMQNANIENCVVTRVKTWRFPRVIRGRPTRVTFPFTDRFGCPAFATDPAACAAALSTEVPPAPAHPFTMPRGAVRAALSAGPIRHDDDDDIPLAPTPPPPSR